MNYDTDVEYDSVLGRSGDSDVYMVYANQKCYPRYLISYMWQRYTTAMQIRRENLKWRME